jgi:hypothetical protein
MRMAFTRLRPTTATRRPLASDRSRTCCSRCTCDEKVEKKIRPSAPWKTPSSPGRTLRSDAVDPVCSTLVESDSNSSTPRPPYSAKAWMFGPRPSIGV